MADTLRDYWESMRHDLGILTPKAAGIEDARPGDEPDWQPQPSNYVLSHHISTACKVVNQHVGLGDSGRMRSLPVAAQTTEGAFVVDLTSVPGLPERGLNAVRRAWWNDGTTTSRLTPVLVDALDLSNDAWVQSDVGTPRRFWIDGYRLFLDPPPSAAGTFQFMASCGVLMPQTEDEGFDQIPADYDPCVLFIALVNYGKSLPADAEMSARAQAFTSDAAAGLERLAAWFSGGSSPQAQPGMVFDARAMGFMRGRARGRR